MDLVGQSFGKWTVIERDERSGYAKYWRCRCSGCNQIHAVYQVSLTLGRSRGCRQCSGSYRTIDMVGQRFGKWEVLSQIKSTGRPCVYWWCKCHGCKTEHEVSSTSLRSGKSTQCTNCSKCKYFKDLTGQQFGSWKVIRYIGNRKWECTCGGCGLNYVNMSDNLFRHNECRSCVERRIWKDHTGKQFGLWKVIEYAGRGSLRWKCLCTSCNRTFEILTRNLTTGESLGCVDCSKFRMCEVQTKRFGKMQCQGYEPLALRFWDEHCPNVIMSHRGPKVPGPKGYDLSPDFELLLDDGRQVVVEIKSIWTLYGTTGLTAESHKTNQYKKNHAKYLKVQEWCEAEGKDFVLWCLDDLESFKLGLEAIGHDPATVDYNEFWRDK